MSTNTTPTKKKAGISWQNLFLWLVIALIVRWQILEPRWIPSGSMLPTLQIQDRILVEKITPRIYRRRNKSLKIGSVVVFHPPARLLEAGYDKNSALIKRVVGLPGDEIEIQNGQLFRNGELVKEIWRDSPINYEMEVIRIPEHQLWVLGDNRNNSLDSHLWGPLPEENVIGTAVWRYWPLQKFGPIRFSDQNLA
ncbi:signal peptidase I [Prochlorococcus sp. MIT 1341]|uniref:signal peptidase I n=1 Tax=Prochlorococcus sp. MIT 1341 TaxID=3096221 RepID=UPI002A765B92|nr:signal peptidase I [Prochlorococcus sp. MIT 1341]